MGGCYLIGVIFYVTQYPECKHPGKFDRGVCGALSVVLRGHLLIGFDFSSLRMSFGICGWSQGLSRSILFVNIVTKLLPSVVCTECTEEINNHFMRIEMR